MASSRLDDHDLQNLGIDYPTIDVNQNSLLCVLTVRELLLRLVLWELRFLALVQRAVDHPNSAGPTSEAQVLTSLSEDTS